MAFILTNEWNIWPRLGIPDGVVDYTCTMAKSQMVSKLLYQFFLVNKLLYQLYN